jgi:hypothetical protein
LSRRKNVSSALQTQFIYSRIEEKDFFSFSPPSAFHLIAFTTFLARTLLPFPHQSGCMEKILSLKEEEKIEGKYIFHFKLARGIIPSSWQFPVYNGI